MTVKMEGHIGDERCTDVLIVISRRFQMCKNTSTKSDNTRSLTNVICHQSTGVDTVADADMNVMHMVDAS